MNSHRRRLSSTAPVPERPATKSSKSGMQNVFWTSTARRQRRKESSAAGPIPCLSDHASASRARSSYGTRQTSPTRLGSKCLGSCSSRIALYPVALLVLLVLLLHGAPGYPVGAVLLSVLILCGVERLLVDLLSVLGQVVLDVVRQLSDLLVGHLDPLPSLTQGFLPTPCLRPIGAGLTLSKGLVEKREGRSPAKPGPRPVEGSTASSTLGAALKLEGDLHVDLVANYVAVLDHDVHVLHPAALHAP